MLDIIYRPGTKNDLYYLKNDDEDERIVKSLFSFLLKKKKKKNRRIRKYFAVIEPFQRSGKILKVNTFCEITNTFHVVPFFKICIQTDPASRIFNPPQRFNAV